ncbi:hypothetical protein [Pyxidicoccus sp. MSG2]|uniref:hypothetical protein n=1 Tax=Pyxidicoccus sp. MSG2 TaxID=2996790 RepID=UPI00226E44D1|nr:hypothetical protein [Pyxidicoccus sp. MSG2]MCY1019305.1 hypothetical protein [Pyxidicoccus sp. MSG2]
MKHAIAAMCLVVAAAFLPLVSHAQDCANPNAVPVSSSNIRFSSKPEGGIAATPEIVISAQINDSTREISLSGIDAQQAIANALKTTFAPFLIEQKIPGAACAIPFCIAQRPTIDAGSFYSLDCTGPAGGIYSCHAKPNPQAAAFENKLPIDKAALALPSAYGLDPQSLSVNIEFVSGSASVLFSSGKSSFSLRRVLAPCDGPIQTQKIRYPVQLQVPNQGLIFVQPIWQPLLGDCVQALNFLASAQAAKVEKTGVPEGQAVVYTQSSASVSATYTIGFRFGSQSGAAPIQSLQQLTQPLGELKITPLPPTQIPAIDQRYRYLPEFQTENRLPLVLMISENIAQVGAFGIKELPYLFLRDILSISDLRDVYSYSSCQKAGWTAFEDTTRSNDTLVAGQHFIVIACKDNGADPEVYVAARNASGKPGIVTQGGIRSMAQDASNITPCLPDNQCDWWPDFVSQLRAANLHYSLGYLLRRR